MVEFHEETITSCLQPNRKMMSSVPLVQIPIVLPIYSSQSLQAISRRITLSISLSFTKKMNFRPIIWESISILEKERFWEKWDTKFYCSWDRQKDLGAELSCFFQKKKISIYTIIHEFFLQTYRIYVGEHDFIFFYVLANFKA